MWITNGNMCYNTKHVKWMECYESGPKRSEVKYYIKFWYGPDFFSIMCFDTEQQRQEMLNKITLTSSESTSEEGTKSVYLVYQRYPDGNLIPVRVFTEHEKAKTWCAENDCAFVDTMPLDLNV